MDDGAQDRRMDGVGDADALRGCERFGVSPGEAERREVDLDEIRLGLRRIDRQARSTSSIVPPLLRVATTPRFQM